MEPWPSVREVQRKLEFTSFAQLDRGKLIDWAFRRHLNVKKEQAHVALAEHFDERDLFAQIHIERELTAARTNGLRSQHKTINRDVQLLRLMFVDMLRAPTAPLQEG